MTEITSTFSCIVHFVSAGDAGEAKQQRSGVRSQGVEEGHHFAGR